VEGQTCRQVQRGSAHSGVIARANCSRRRSASGCCGGESERPRSADGFVGPGPEQPLLRGAKWRNESSEGGGSSTTYHLAKMPDEVVPELAGELCILCPINQQ